MSSYYSSLTITTTSTDPYAALVTSSTPVDQTPAHTIIIQNKGAGPLRVGDGVAVAGNGYMIAASAEISWHIRTGTRLYVIGDGASVSNVNIQILLD